MEYSVVSTISHFVFICYWSFFFLSEFGRVPVSMANWRPALRARSSVTRGENDPKMGEAKKLPSQHRPHHPYSTCKNLQEEETIFHFGLFSSFI